MTAPPPLRILPLPDLGGIEVARSVEARLHYPRHIEATFSIGAIEAGAIRAFHRGRLHLMPAGSVGMVGPEEVHTSEPAERAGSWSARGFYPRLEQLAAVASDLAGRRLPAPRLRETVVQDNDLWGAIRAACLAAEQGAPALAREALLHRALSLLVTRAGGLVPVERPLREPRAVRRARELLAATPDGRYGMAALAAAVGLSVDRLTRAFRATHGLPPHAWHLQHRLARARALIIAGTPIAEAAAATGFADQPHLTRHFRRTYGVTPGALAPRAGIVQDAARRPAG
ncbi:AraC family transcriptional regulator [Elioraea sp.]|uniref:helix-turn-helix domain-containing protein n=1 Tax=Elioraea sp. TaxID=2185103 RepID=UPI0021DC2E33|nr:AraC family transcriptional regulator [Elioraea sp.]GIX10747.1 MAG: transcriptional regulator [Elioraea sp.]